MKMSAQAIIERLDEAPASPDVKAKIALRILMSINRRNDLTDEIIKEYHSKFEDKEKIAIFGKRITQDRILRDREEDEILAHLARNLLPYDDKLDGELAEYYYYWAEKLGIEESKVTEIFIEAGV